MRAAMLLALTLAGCDRPQMSGDAVIVNCSNGEARFDIGGEATPGNLTSVAALALLDKGDSFGDGVITVGTIAFSGTVATVACPAPIHAIAFVRR